jgi:hypothetical protein
MADKWLMALPEVSALQLCETKGYTYLPLEQKPALEKPPPPQNAGGLLYVSFKLYYL